MFCKWDKAVSVLFALGNYFSTPSYKERIVIKKGFCWSCGSLHPGAAILICTYAMTSFLLCLIYALLTPFVTDKSTIALT